jgi:rhodanese-related sulfurtransferase
LTDDEARETIRISMGSYTSMKDVVYMIKVLNNYFEGKALFVSNVTSSQLNESMLSDPDNFFLDIRPEFQRKKLPGHKSFKVIHYSKIEKQQHLIPRDKNVVVTCETGQLSLLTAYTLKSNGYTKVSSLKDGIRGWHALRS